VGSELRECGVTKLIGIEPAPALAAKALEHYDQIIVSRLEDVDAADIESPAVIITATSLNTW
jgi:hypothetical protein